VTVRLVLGILVGLIVALRLGQRAMARRQRALRPGGGHRCPSCGAERLVITEAIALPREIDLEAIACRRCDLRGVAVRGATEHRAYPTDPLVWGRLSAALRRCPAPRDRACACATHAQYGARPLDEVPHDTAASFDLNRT
jgi:hypothetical protein